MERTSTGGSIGDTVPRRSLLIESLSRRVEARWILLVILVVAACIRMHGLSGVNLWGDERATLAIVNRGFDGILAARDTIHPPGYPLLARAVQVMGLEGDWSIRLPSIAAGLLGVGVAFAALRAMGAPRYAAFSGLLTSNSVYHVYYSQEARGYMWMSSLTALAFVLALKHLRRPSRGRLALALVACLAAGCFHYSAGLACASLVAILLTRDVAHSLGGRRVGTGVIWLSLAGLVVIAAYLASARLATLSQVLTDGNSVTRVRLGPGLVHGAVSRWVGIGPWAAGVVSLLVLLGLASCFRHSVAVGFLMASWFLSTFVSVMILPASNVFFDVRYLMASMPAAPVLVAMGLAGTKRALGRLPVGRCRSVLSYLPGTLGVVLLCLQAPIVMSYASRPRKEFPWTVVTQFGLDHISFSSIHEPWLVSENAGNEFAVTTRAIGPLVCPTPSWPGRWLRGTSIDRFRMKSPREYDHVEVDVRPAGGHHPSMLDVSRAGPFKVSFEACTLDRTGERGFIATYHQKASKQRVGLLELFWRCGNHDYEVVVRVVSVRIDQALQYLRTVAREVQCHASKPR